MLFRQLEYLSASMAKLEHELAVTLINRGHNFEGLTAEGERLVVWARRILAEKDAFKAEAAAVQSGITGTLRLGVEPTASTTLALTVAAFCSAYPLAKIKVESRLSSTELHRRLREFELDAAIAQFDVENGAGLHIVPLYEERYVVVASNDRLLANNSAMRWVDAAQLPLALPTPHVRILPHTWLHALPVIGTTRVARLIEPDTRARIGAAAKGLALNDELFKRPLTNAPAGVDRPRLSLVQR